MKRTFSYQPIVWLFILLLVPVCSKGVWAQDRSPEALKTVYGFGGILGNSFDPSGDIPFLQLSGFGMWDYDRVWRHWAPDPLRFKVEGTIGATTGAETRLMLSVEMLALFYLDGVSTKRLLPYIEGGIGVIYTDFQVEDKNTREKQGYRLNFNPLIGIGTDIKTDSGTSYFTSVRLSHISNADFHSQNRGLNSVLLIIGRYF